MELEDRIHALRLQKQAKEQYDNEIAQYWIAKFEKLRKHMDIVPKLGCWVKKNYFNLDIGGIYYTVEDYYDTRKPRYLRDWSIKDVIKFAPRAYEKFIEKITKYVKGAKLDTYYCHYCGSRQ